MKKSEFKQLIREEIRKVLNEAVTIDPALKDKLKVALTARKRDPEDENAHNAVEVVLTQIYKKAGRKDAKELASGNMEDESTMTGPLSAVMSLINDTLSEPKSASKGKSIYIVDTFQDYDVATIKATPAGSEIKERFADWKYVFAGSPEQLVKELIKIKAVHTASGKYIESDTERDSIRKGIKALGSKLKKVRA